MTGLGRLLIIIGLALAGVGLVFVFAGKIPFLGRLPGDIVMQRPGFTFYFPLGTSILLSLVVSLIFWILNR